MRPQRTAQLKQYTWTDGGPGRMILKGPGGIAATIMTVGGLQYTGQLRWKIKETGESGIELSLEAAKSKVKSLIERDVNKQVVSSRTASVGYWDQDYYYDNSGRVLATLMWDDDESGHIAEYYDGTSTVYSPTFPTEGELKSWVEQNVVADTAPSASQYQWNLNKYVDDFNDPEGVIGLVRQTDGTWVGRIVNLREVGWNGEGGVQSESSPLVSELEARDWVEAEIAKSSRRTASDDDRWEQIQHPDLGTAYILGDIDAVEYDRDVREDTAVIAEGGWGDGQFTITLVDSTGQLVDGPYYIDSLGVAKRLGEDYVDTGRLLPGTPS